MEIGSAAPLPSPIADDPKTRREEGVEPLRASEMLILLAERVEKLRRSGRLRAPPPFELVYYPDLFERAWGWDSLLPHDMITPLAVYKIYLRRYYIRNHQREANAAAAAADDLSLDGDDHGNGLLATLVDKCIKTEENLKRMWNCRSESFTIDDDENELPLVSDNITKHAREMVLVSGSESPPTAIALKCIIKEAELMCQCIISGDSVVSFSVSNAVQQCALNFMTCKEYDYVSAAAAMMGIMKETELAIVLLRGDQCKINANLTRADCYRHRTMLIMLELRDEWANTTGDLNSNESDDKLADNGNHEERGNVSENKNSKEKLAVNDMDGGNRTDENQNPNEKLGRNHLEKGEVKPNTEGCPYMSEAHYAAYVPNPEQHPTWSKKAIHFSSGDGGHGSVDQILVLQQELDEMKQKVDSVLTSLLELKVEVEYVVIAAVCVGVALGCIVTNIWK